MEVFSSTFLYPEDAVLETTPEIDTLLYFLTQELVGLVPTDQISLYGGAQDGEGRRHFQVTVECSMLQQCKDVRDVLEQSVRDLYLHQDVVLYYLVTDLVAE